MKVLIADATPLILLAKVALLEALTDHFTIMTTEQVAWEATWRKELPDAIHILKLIELKKIKIGRINPQEVETFKKQWGIGLGEASALLLAEKEKSVIVTDDFSAMKVARLLRVPFVTSLILIVQMEKKGILSRGLAKAKIEALREHAWFDAEIFDDATRLLEGGS